MIEIEAKMRLSDPEVVVTRLRALDADLDVEVLEVNTFFDSPDGRLKSSDQGLRVRVEMPVAGPRRAVITHKGPRAHGKLKSRSETEAEVIDARAAGELLGALGYHPVLTFEKRRQRWLLDGCRVELDEVPHLGHFIEIEGDSDEAVLAAREALGLGEVPLIRASYIAMLATYARDHNLPAEVIRFPQEEPVAV